MGALTESPAAHDCLAARPRTDVRALLLPASIVFLGAFLLFQIQPLIAKMILPWFGGSAAVWTTCVLFFQLGLFLGYVYAHWLTERHEPAWQARIHATLLAASLLALPVIPGDYWKPLGQEEPVTRILGLLAVTVGLPYFLLASTSPLVQSWMARRGMTSLPYRFYALSNLASLSALLLYPVLLEPLVPTRMQTAAWSVAFVVYAAGMALFAFRRPPDPHALAAAAASSDPAPSPGAQALWLVLSAAPSALSLAVTNHLCQNLAPIPFLWVLPLGIYLLSLILCFDSDGWYRRPVVLPLNAAAIAGASWLVVHQTPATPARLVVPALAAVLFVVCMYLQGELARRKPAPRHLTRFYLMLALGGMLGGGLVSLGAPFLLPAHYEFPLAIAACAFLTLMVEYRKHWAWDAVFAAAAVASIVAATLLIGGIRKGSIAMARNFYGGIRVVDAGPEGPLPARRTLVHGVISHGMQFLDPARRGDATTYYSPGSGIALALHSFRRPGMQVGLVGLGAGTLAAYGQPGEFYRFYEIDPQVAAMARGYFTFLRDSKAHVEVAIGDGRLHLEREPPARFDLIAVDAFSGDSIPVHLLTREAVELYLSRLRSGGVLALHISNTALRLAPVVESIAANLGVDALAFAVPGDAALGRSQSEWMLVAPRGVFDDHPGLRALGRPAPADASLPVWTDDYSNLFRILK
jgi:hypothetical protein